MNQHAQWNVERPQGRLSDPYQEQYDKLQRERSLHDSQLENDYVRKLLEELNQTTTQLFSNYLHSSETDRALAFAYFYHLNNFQQLVRNFEMRVYPSETRYTFQYQLNLRDHYNQLIFGAQHIQSAKENLFHQLRLIRAPFVYTSVDGSPEITFTRTDFSQSIDEERLQEHPAQQRKLSPLARARQGLQGAREVENSALGLQAWSKELTQALYAKASRELRLFLDARNFTALEHVLMYGVLKAHHEGTFTTSLNIENNQSVAIELRELLNTYGLNMITAQAYSLDNRPDITELEISFRK